MTKLYVANTTKQDHHFAYKAPEDRNNRQQLIKSGTQIMVYRDDTLAVLTAIVDQHLKYGLIDAAKIDQTEPFIGLCYSFDKPIPVDKIMYVSEHNDDALLERGLDIRKTQAAALFGQIQDAGGREQGLSSLEIEIAEETKADAKGFNEVVEVQENGAAPATSGRNTPKGGRRGRARS